MPIYKYKCANCGNTFTKLQKISDAYPKASCCDNVSLQRLIGESSFALSGGGWYADGYDSAKSAQSTESN